MPERHDHRKNLTYESESSVAPSHSFCRCTTFWRGTTCSATIVETLLRLFSLTAETSAKPKPGFQPQSRSCRASWDGAVPLVRRFPARKSEGSRGKPGPCGTAGAAPCVEMAA